MGKWLPEPGTNHLILFITFKIPSIPNYFMTLSVYMYTVMHINLLQNENTAMIDKVG